MGMFDEVRVPCPTCGKVELFQSKGGRCVLAVYDLDEAPEDVLSDIGRHGPMKCEECGTTFEVSTRTSLSVRPQVSEIDETSDIFTEMAWMPTLRKLARELNQMLAPLNSVQRGEIIEEVEKGYCRYCSEKLNRYGNCFCQNDD